MSLPGPLIVSTAIGEKMGEIDNGGNKEGTMVTTAQVLAHLAEAKQKLESDGWTPEAADCLLQAFSEAQAQAVAARVRTVLVREFPRLKPGRMDLWDPTLGRWLQVNWLEGDDPTVAWLPATAN
jgi:hypothetical protein